jgi:hypothetical protein
MVTSFPQNVKGMTAEPQQLQLTNADCLCGKQWRLYSLSRTILLQGDNAKRLRRPSLTLPNSSRLG